MMYFTAQKQWVKVEEHFQAMTGEKPEDAVARAPCGEMLVAQDKC